MKCPMCGGDGITDKFTPNVGRCIKCNGSGEIEPTNEEWLHSLNTEQLAEWMALRLNQGILLALRMKYHCDGVDAVRGWLKEKHDDNMGRNP